MAEFHDGNQWNLWAAGDISAGERFWVYIDDQPANPWDNIPTATCGNGIVETAEECDDGNLTDRDGCSSECTIEEILPELQLTVDTSYERLPQGNN